MAKRKIVFQKHRARLEIINHIIGFSTSTLYGDNKHGHSAMSDYCFRHVSDVYAVPVGSLIMLTSAPTSKWYLSWLVEVKKEHFGPNFLLESIEDGSLCWWSNVGIKMYPTETLEEHPNWRWTDKQFKLNNQWMRAARKNSYVLVPNWLRFDGDKVTMSLRTRFSIDGFTSERTIQNSRKLLVRDMVAFVNEAEEERQRQIDSKKDLTNESQ